MRSPKGPGMILPLTASGDCRPNRAVRADDGGLNPAPLAILRHLPRSRYRRLPL